MFPYRVKYQGPDWCYIWRRFCEKKTAKKNKFKHGNPLSNMAYLRSTPWNIDSSITPFFLGGIAMLDLIFLYHFSQKWGVFWYLKGKSLNFVFSPLLVPFMALQKRTPPYWGTPCMLISHPRLFTITGDMPSQCLRYVIITTNQVSPGAELAKPKPICYCLWPIRIQNSKFYPIRA